MATTPKWQWHAVVWDRDNDSHPIGSLSFDKYEARLHGGEQVLAAAMAAAQWPGKRLEISVSWNA